jgi:uncharacterized protein YndB with AHSA1/START domain
MDRSLEATVRLKGDRDEAFNCLTDYPRLCDWLPGVESARVLAREGDVVVAEVRAPGLGAPGLVLELVHSPPGLAHFTRVDQYRGEGTSGTWELIEEDDGEVELRVRLRPGQSFAGARGRKRLRAGLEKVIEAIRHGLEEKTAEPEIESEVDGRRKILEVTRRGNTVVVWHRGKVFELRRRAEDG